MPCVVCVCLSSDDPIEIADRNWVQLLSTLVLYYALPPPGETNQKNKNKKTKWFEGIVTATASNQAGSMWDRFRGLIRLENDRQNVPSFNYQQQPFNPFLILFFISSFIFCP